MQEIQKCRKVYENVIADLVGKPSDKLFAPTKMELLQNENAILKKEIASLKKRHENHAAIIREFKKENILLKTELIEVLKTIFLKIDEYADNIDHFWEYNNIYDNTLGLFNQGLKELLNIDILHDSSFLKKQKNQIRMQHSGVTDANMRLYLSYTEWSELALDKKFFIRSQKELQ